MLDELKAAVCEANLELQRQRLVICSWGNVSGIDRERGIVAIKPSGVAYDKLTADTIVLVDLSGKQVEGELKPSSDTPTHLELYRNFASIGGVCHTHSSNATVWAQACLPVPCFGTTHADHFYGEIPVTPVMSAPAIDGEYELNTGKAIVETFRSLDHANMPAVLVANHGPFTWGKSPAKAVEASVVLEQVAEMAIKCAMLRNNLGSIPAALLNRHFFRKHGKNAYYGQT